MIKKILVCAVPDLVLGSVWPFRYGLVSGFVLKSAERVYALKNFCTHMGGPLVKCGGKFKCLWHEAEFDINSGQALPGFPAPPGSRLEELPTIIEDGKVYVTISIPDDPFS